MSARAAIARADHVEVNVPGDMTARITKAEALRLLAADQQRSQDSGGQIPQELGVYVSDGIAYLVAAIYADHTL